VTEKQPRTLNTSPLRPGEWSQLPDRAIRSGAIRKLTRAAAVCYIVLVLRAKLARGGTVAIGQNELGSITGLSVRSVRAGLHQLGSLGLVQRVHRGGGREGDATIYRVLASDENRQSASGSEPAESRTRTGRIAYQNRQKGVPEPEAGFHPTYSRNHISRRAVDVAGDEEGKGPVSSSTAAAPADGQAVHAELARFGVTEPKRSELVAMPGLTVNIIRELAGRTGKAANPAGLLVSMLEREGPALAAKARGAATARERTATASEARIAAREAQAVRVAREREERHQLLVGLDTGQLARYVQRVLQDATATERGRWKSADPLKNPHLGARVVELAKRDRAAAGKHAEAPGTLAPLP